MSNKNKKEKEDKNIIPISQISEEEKNLQLKIFRKKIEEGKKNNSNYLIKGNNTANKIFKKKFYLNDPEEKDQKESKKKENDLVINLVDSDENENKSINSEENKIFKNKKNEKEELTTYYKTYSKNSYRSFASEINKNELNKIKITENDKKILVKKNSYLYTVNNLNKNSSNFLNKNNNTDSNNNGNLNIKKKLDFSNEDVIMTVNDSNNNDLENKKPENFWEKIEKINTNLNKMNIYNNVSYNSNKTKENRENDIIHIDLCDNLTTESSDNFINKYPVEISENLRKFVERKNDEINYPKINDRDLQSFLR